MKLNICFRIWFSKAQLKETKTQMKQYNNKYGEFYSSCDVKTFKDTEIVITSHIHKLTVFIVLYRIS